MFTTDAGMRNLLTLHFIFYSKNTKSPTIGIQNFLLYLARLMAMNGIAEVLFSGQQDRKHDQQDYGKPIVEPEHVIVRTDFITTHQVFKVVNKVVHFVWEKLTKTVRNTGTTLPRALIFGTIPVRYKLQMVKKWRFLNLLV